MDEMAGGWVGWEVGDDVAASWPGGKNSVKRGLQSGGKVK